MKHLVVLFALCLAGCGPRVLTTTITVAEDARQKRLFEQWIAENTVRKPVVAQSPHKEPKP